MDKCQKNFAELKKPDVKNCTVYDCIYKKCL